MASQAELRPCNDDEYIGAVLGFAQELARYVIGRAGEVCTTPYKRKCAYNCIVSTEFYCSIFFQNDIASISLCRNLVTELNGKMLEFNFRNGNLRRKYDILKYSLRTIENTLYELSLVDNGLVSSETVGLSEGAAISDVAAAESPQKRVKKENSTTASSASSATSSLDGGSVDTIVLSGQPSDAIVKEILPSLPVSPAVIGGFIDVEGIDAVRVRMEAYDARREEVIKQSRDVQKLSKQAVYSVQRGALDDAKAKLDKARVCAMAILELIKDVSQSFLCVLWFLKLRIC